MPSPTPGTALRGAIMPIGGAEAKVGNRAVLDHFLTLAGGADARVAVVPTASQLDDTGAYYAALFGDIGATHVDVLDIDERPDASRDDYCEVLEQATGIFLTGGNQLRLSTILGGTPVAQCLRRRNAAGVVVAGTSAGAAIMPEHMIAGGESGATPTADGVIMAPGLGLTNRLVLDQHFRQRDRLGRLLSAVSFNPFAVGVGLDEDTAVVLGPDNVFEVVGSGGVTIVDPSDLVYSSMDSALPGEPVNLVGLTLHVLGHGGRFDIETRYAAWPPRPDPDWADEPADELDAPGGLDV